ncbi:nickel pincer cofactor biosynthesis protein LarC [uncultured Cellulomonas sp.]|uniref:nickel pincer cofactor biosynthesis protein LarC n=1 Tax=uncultured Cellulomonas sp. TaxID=189682 RepID=UPI0028ED3F0B|nr:nickel pincer cofactor biosynthesis protein LarC [uncultured Cellulomonas sp.]
MRNSERGPAGDPRRVAWIDARNGVAGDMLLGALVDAGATLETLQGAIDEVIPGTVTLSSRQVLRAGMRATKVDVELVAPDQPHRLWTEIRHLLSSAPGLDDTVRERALTVFRRLAEAEARAHGIDPEEVHFHEVGAWDSIADVVGVCAALGELGVVHVTAGAVGLGSGSISTAHGQIPVPVPAVLELSAGWRVVAGGAGELATPTGMALVTALSAACEDLPAVTVAAVGVGAGTRDTAGRPNVVRVVLGAAVETEADLEDCVVLEANIDDLDPRVWPSVLATLIEAGASDAWLTPILMKKGRPAHTLAVLASHDSAAGLRARVFDLVPTLGVRETPVRRSVLDRCWRTVDVDGAAVRIKLGHRQGIVVTATPEFEDAARVAQESGTPVRHVLGRAAAAADAAGLVPGAPVPD